jgi:hypothetical protein
MTTGHQKKDKDYVQKDFRPNFIFYFQSLKPIFANHILSSKNVPLLKFPELKDNQKISNTRVLTSPFRNKMTTGHQKIGYGLCSKGFSP